MMFVDLVTGFQIFFWSAVGAFLFVGFLWLMK